MDLSEAIYTRRAVREFTTEPVDEKTLRQLIDAAIQAPSAVNQQPWSFCVVRDQAVLTRISNEAKPHMLRTSPAALLHHFQERLSNPSFHIFYHAPALVLISSVAESPWAVENCSLAAENLMLAARAAGLGTCWIGFAQTWLGTSFCTSAAATPKVGQGLRGAAPATRAMANLNFDFMVASQRCRRRSWPAPTR